MSQSPVHGADPHRERRPEPAEASPPIIADILRIDNLWQFESLRKLQLDNNIIERIEGLESLTQLVWLGEAPSCVTALLRTTLAKVPPGHALSPGRAEALSAGSKKGGSFPKPGSCAG